MKLDRDRTQDQRGDNGPQVITGPAKAHDDKQLPLVPSHPDLLNRIVQGLRLGLVDGIDGALEDGRSSDIILEAPPRDDFSLIFCICHVLCWSRDRLEHEAGGQLRYILVGRNEGPTIGRDCAIAIEVIVLPDQANNGKSMSPAHAANRIVTHAGRKQKKRKKRKSGAEGATERTILACEPCRSGGPISPTAASSE